MSCSSSWTFWQSCSAGEKLFATFIKSAATLLLHSRPAIRRFSPWSTQASTTATRTNRQSVSQYLGKISLISFLINTSLYPWTRDFCYYIMSAAKFPFKSLKPFYLKKKACAGGISTNSLSLLGYEECEWHSSHSWLVSTPLKGVSLLWYICIPPSSFFNIQYIDMTNENKSSGCFARPVQGHMDEFVGGDRAWHTLMSAIVLYCL